MAGFVPLSEVKDLISLPTSLKYVLSFGSFGDVAASLPYAEKCLEKESKARLLIASKHFNLACIFISNIEKIVVCEDAVLQNLYVYISTTAKSRTYRADLYAQSLHTDCIRSLNINHYDYFSRLVQRGVLSYFEALNTLCGIRPGYSPSPESVKRPGTEHIRIENRLNNPRRNRKIAILNVHNQSNVNASPEFWIGLIKEVTTKYSLDCFVNHTMLSLEDAQDRIGHMLPESRFICLTPDNIIKTFSRVDLIIGVAGGAMEIAHCFTKTRCYTLGSPCHQWPKDQEEEARLINEHRKTSGIHPLLLDSENLTDRKIIAFPLPGAGKRLS